VAEDYMHDFLHFVPVTNLLNHSSASVNLKKNYHRDSAIHLKF